MNGIDRCRKLFDDIISADTNDPRAAARVAVERCRKALSASDLATLMSEIAAKLDRLRPRHPLAAPAIVGIYQLAGHNRRLAVLEAALGALAEPVQPTPGRP